MINLMIKGNFMGKKTVIITGASKGIGYETALLFGEKSWNVVINYNNSEGNAAKLAKILSEMGVETLVLKADISKHEEVKFMFKEAEKKFGQIHSVVCNAGISQQSLFTDLTDEDIDTMIDVNLKGVIYCCQEAARQMLCYHEGSIVNISSIYGTNGGSCEVHYSAAKAGVIGLTKGLAKELGPSSIRVNCIAPGAIETPMNAHLTQEAIDILNDETPLCRMGKAREIAESIYFLASDQSSFITGQVLGVNGGIEI